MFNNKALRNLVRKANTFDWTKADRFFDEFETDIDQFSKDMAEVFANSNGLSFVSKTFDKLDVPRVNVKAVTEGTVYEVEAPGFDKEDFSIEVEDRELRIKADKKVNEEVKEDNYVRQEFHTTSFVRTVSLPPGVDPEAVTAKYENGVLRISVPVAIKKEKSLIAVR